MSLLPYCFTICKEDIDKMSHLLTIVHFHLTFQIFILSTFSREVPKPNSSPYLSWAIPSRWRKGFYGNILSGPFLGIFGRNEMLESSKIKARSIEYFNNSTILLVVSWSKLSLPFCNYYLLSSITNGEVFCNLVFLAPLRYLWRFLCT